MAPTGTLDADNIVVGTADGAGLWVAPAGTALPTDAKTALDTAFTAVGYIAEDGQPTMAQSLETEDVKAWQSLAALRSILTAKELTLAFTLMEVNPVAMGLYFGTAAPTAAGGDFKVDISSTALPPTQVCVVDVKDGLSVVRLVLNKATLSENGDTEFSRSAATGFPVTLKALDDNGKLGSLYFDDGATVAAAASSPSGK